jgi:hypothetical protein
MRGDPKYQEISATSASAKQMSTRSKAGSGGKAASSSPAGGKRA